MFIKTRQEIASELGCSVKILNKWLQPISKSLGIQRYQRYFTPKQVAAIYEYLVITEEKM